MRSKDEVIDGFVIGEAIHHDFSALEGGRKIGGHPQVGFLEHRAGFGSPIPRRDVVARLLEVRGHTAPHRSHA